MKFCFNILKNVKMANIKAVIAILVIIIIILAAVAVRFACWGFCRENFCPNGIECCKDDNDEVVVVIQDDSDEDRRRPGTPRPGYIRPNAPPPEEQMEGLTY